MRQTTGKRKLGVVISLILAMLIAFPLTALASVGDEPIWTVHNATGEIGGYVDVRLELTTITADGMGVTHIVLNFDNSVINNPTRSPRVERNSLTSEQQTQYDFLTGSGMSQEAVWGFFPASAGTNAPLHDQSIFSLRSGDGWGNDQVSIIFQPTRIGTMDAGLFVDIRFDVATTSAATSPVTFYLLSMAGYGDDNPTINLASQRAGTVTISGGQTVTSYTVTFNANYGANAVIDAVTVPAGETIADTPNVSMPANPTREGYTFASWNTAADGTGAAFVATTPVNSNKTVYAQWTQASGVTPFKVNFGANGGVFADGETGIREVNPGEYIGAANMPVPTREGFTFAGWQTVGGEPFTYSTPVNSDKVVMAQWTPVNVTAVTVTFDPTYGELANNESGYRTLSPGAWLNAGDMPVNPTLDGYRFGRWNTAPDGTGTNFGAGTAVNQSKTVYAIWYALDDDDATFAVTFHGNGGIVLPENASRWVDTGNGLGANMPINPTREGHTFTGWNTVANGTGTPFTSTTPVTESITVYAQWTANQLPPPPPPQQPPIILVPPQPPGQTIPDTGTPGSPWAPGDHTGTTPYTPGTTGDTDDYDDIPWDWTEQPSGSLNVPPPGQGSAGGESTVDDAPPPVVSLSDAFNPSRSNPQTGQSYALVAIKVFLAGLIISSIVLILFAKKKKVNG